MTINLAKVRAWLAHAVAPFVATFAVATQAASVNNDRAAVAAAVVAVVTTVLHTLQGSIKNP